MKRPYSVGVVVGRFQVARLHPGHRYLLDFVSSLHSELMVVLGTPLFPTPRNPLTFDMRREMIHKTHPHARIVELQDRRVDADWVAALDALIEYHFPSKDVVLYGSRDSFLPYYTGRYKTEYVETKGSYSGTDERKKVHPRMLRSNAFRSGVIHGWTSRLPVTRPMVDIAIIKRETNEVLLGGNAEDPADRWRFPGGLVDQTDASLEVAALREAHEEVSHLELSSPRYVGSTITSDWRYRGSGECGMTTLFEADYLFGAPSAGDDLARVAWVPLSKLLDVLVEEHKPLGTMLLTYRAATAAKAAA